jgi:hypothetical protein
MENGDGSGLALCDVYVRTPMLFVYTPTGAPYPRGGY